jgi:methionine-S-sulfoxide reductase
MEEEGYGEFLEPFLQKGITTIDLSTPTTNPEEVYLAGGCFWGLQHLLRQVPGVLFTEVGYTGGDVWDPTYTHHGTHAEAVRVFFDPERLTFEGLLRWFFRMHDPTTIHRQGNDIGPSYRSAIFYKTQRQRRIALNFIERLNRLSGWGKPIVTEVEPAGIFFRAEEEHQDYLIKHPDGYTCHYLRPESILGF